MPSMNSLTLEHEGWKGFMEPCTITFLNKMDFFFYSPVLNSPLHGLQTAGVSLFGPVQFPSQGACVAGVEPRVLLSWKALCR